MSQRHSRRHKRRRSTSGTTRRGSSQTPPPEAQALVRLYREGRMPEAINGSRLFVREWPKIGLGWNVLAAACEAVGRLDEARTAYESGLEVEPANAAACNNLGNVLSALGQSAEAAEAYRRALRIDPGFVEARHNLGMALADLGRYEEAVGSYREALEAAPRMSNGYNNLGNALLALGRFDESEQAYRSALAHAPQNAQFWSNLGNVLTKRHRFEAAIAAHDRAVELAPDAARLRQNRGVALQEIQHLAEAEAEFHQALALEPTGDGIQLNLANVVKCRGRLEEAEALYRERVEAYPESASSHTDLANLLADMGRTEEAAAHYRRALANDPDNPFALYSLATIRTFTESDDPDVGLLERALQRCDAAVDATGAAAARYAVAKAYDDLDVAADRVFSFYAAGAAAKRSTFDYDVASEEALFRQIARACPADCFPAPSSSAGNAPSPVFVVGMPRSGTTLVEQILASHPEVQAGGERQELMRLGERAMERCGCDFPALLEPRRERTPADMGRQYRETVLESLAGESRYFTDKMPANFKGLGLIPWILPDARIVHVRRNPAATCLSCFTQLFADGQWFSYDLEDLGRYYQAYDGLMQHWRSALPRGWMIEIEYEALIASPETETRRLLDFCDLEWAPECLDFHRTSRRVTTASSQQVRQPLYRSAVERWRRFEPYLGDLFDALGPSLW